MDHTEHCTVIVNLEKRRASKHATSMLGQNLKQFRAALAFLNFKKLQHGSEDIAFYSGPLLRKRCIFCLKNNQLRNHMKENIPGLKKADVEISVHSDHELVHWVV